MIRKAVLSDIPSICELAKEMHEESRYKNFTPNAEKFINTVAKFINNHIALVYERDGKVVGMIFGYTYANYFTDELQASDAMFFVTRKSRGSKAALSLIKGYISAAKEKGAKEAEIIVSSGIEIDRTGKFLEKMGFKNTGSNYVMEL